MNFLSIQGPYAPAFYLNDAEAFKVKCHLESLTGSSILIISTKFRTDIFCNDSKDQCNLMLETWCRCLGKPFDFAVRERFFRSDSETSSLQNFAYRLQLLKKIPQWHDSFYNKLMNILILNAGDPICQKLYRQLEVLFMAVAAYRLGGGKKDVIAENSNFITLSLLANMNQRSYN